MVVIVVVRVVFLVRLNTELGTCSTKSAPIRCTGVGYQFLTKNNLKYLKYHDLYGVVVCALRHKLIGSVRSAVHVREQIHFMTLSVMDRLPYVCE